MIPYITAMAMNYPCDTVCVPKNNNLAVLAVSRLLHSGWVPNVLWREKTAKVKAAERIIMMAVNTMLAMLSQALVSVSSRSFRSCNFLHAIPRMTNGMTVKNQAIVALQSANKLGSVGQKRKKENCTHSCRLI